MKEGMKDTKIGHDRDSVSIVVVWCCLLSSISSAAGIPKSQVVRVPLRIVLLSAQTWVALQTISSTARVPFQTPAKRWNFSRQI